VDEYEATPRTYQHHFPGKSRARLMGKENRGANEPTHTDSKGVPSNQRSQPAGMSKVSLATVETAGPECRNGVGAEAACSGL
jgi:hypothetical protein